MDRVFPREYIPSGPSESMRIRAFAEEKLRSLTSEDNVSLTRDRIKFLAWMEGISNDILGIGGPSTTAVPPKSSQLHAQLSSSSSSSSFSDFPPSANGGSDTHPLPYTSLIGEMREPSTTSLSKLKSMRSSLTQAYGVKVPKIHQQPEFKQQFTIVKETEEEEEGREEIGGTASVGGGGLRECSIEQGQQEQQEHQHQHHQQYQRSALLPSPLNIRASSDLVGDRTAISTSFSSLPNSPLRHGDKTTAEGVMTKERIEINFIGKENLQESLFVNSKVVALESSEELISKTKSLQPTYSSLPRLSTAQSPSSSPPSSPVPTRGGGGGTKTASMMTSSGSFEVDCSGSWKGGSSSSQEKSLSPLPFARSASPPPPQSSSAATFSSSSSSSSSLETQKSLDLSGLTIERFKELTGHY